jgi:hypothetical protein
VSQLYIHRPGHDEPELIEVTETMTVAELIDVHGVDASGAWVEDGEEIVAEEIVIEVVEERGHIHIGKCREIEVKVRYGGVEKEHTFNPGKTIHTVHKWAAGEHGFDLPAAQRADHGLFVPGIQTSLDPDVQVGLVAHDCRLVLDLAPKHRPQG